MSWWTYVERTAKTTRQRDIAERLEIDATNVTRWKSGQIPRADVVAAFARAYRRPVLEAFVAAGFLSAQEAKVRPVAAPAPPNLTNDELLELVRARMSREEGEAHADRAAATKTPDPGPADQPGKRRSDYAVVANEDDELTIEAEQEAEHTT